MAEEKLRVTMIAYRCDVCGKGEMLPTGAMHEILGKKLFVHKCVKCGQGMNFDRTYPSLAKPE